MTQMHNYMKYLPILLLFMMGCDTKEAPKQVQRSVIVIDERGNNEIQVTQSGGSGKIKVRTTNDSIFIGTGTPNYDSSVMVSYDTCKTWHYYKTK